MMDTMSRGGRWFGFLAFVCFLTTVACSSGGGSGGGTGLATRTTGVTLNDGAQVLVPSGNTNAAVIMIAEKGADMIKLASSEEVRAAA